MLGRGEGIGSMEVLGREGEGEGEGVSCPQTIACQAWTAFTTWCAQDACKLRCSVSSLKES